LREFLEFMFVTLFVMAIMYAVSLHAREVQCDPVKIKAGGQFMCTAGDANCPWTPSLRKLQDQLNGGCVLHFEDGACAESFDIYTKMVNCVPLPKEVMK
jgi:hypothetical protein